MAGVALGDIYIRFAWQAWHLVTSTFVLRGRRATYGTGLALVARLVPRDTAPLCVAGVALGGIRRRFTWQAWRSVTSSFVLRGRRATYRTGLALVARLVPVDAAPLCVAGVALGDIRRRFTWQAWHLVTSSFVFAWQACYLWGWAGSGGHLVPRHAWQAWHLVTSAVVSRGRRGTW